MFTITPSAAEQIVRAAQAQSDDSPLPMLRVAAKIDEDGGLVYGMGFDDERDNDIVLDCEGVAILIAPHSQELLDQATLDFVELKPGEFQFVFVNPLESQSPPGGGCASGGSSGCGGCGGGTGGCA